MNTQLTDNYKMAMSQILLMVLVNQILTRRKGKIIKQPFFPLPLLEFRTVH